MNNDAIPQFLYHGTAINHDEGLPYFDEGLRGRRAGEVATHRGRPSVPGIVYLSDVFAIWYAALARHERDRELILVLEIDTSTLPPCFVPDEDFLEFMAGRDDERVKPHKFRTDVEGPKSGKAFDPRAYPSLALPSLTEFGCIGYDGVIPPAAITRALVLDRNEEIFEHYLDSWSNPITLDAIATISTGHRAVHEHHFDARPYGDDLGALLNSYADDAECDQLRRDYEYANERRHSAQNVLTRPESGWNHIDVEAFVQLKAAKKP